MSYFFIRVLTLLTYCSEIWNVVNGGRYDFWIGISDSGSEGTWKFTNEETVSSIMFSWYPGEPNNSGNEDCASFSYDYGRSLVDHPCRNHHHVMCQMPTGNC